MNSGGITKETLLSTFPAALRENVAIAALGDITAEALAARTPEIARLSLYSRIDELPETLLDILAYDYKVDWWDANYSLTEKRRTLADSWRVHKLLGTKYAVGTTLRAIYPDAKVSEWFQYGGEPHHFRVNIPITGTFTPPMKDELLRMIDIVKRLSSWLDSIITSFEMEGRISITPFLGKPTPITKLPELEPVFPGTFIHFTPILGNGPQSTALPPLEPLFPAAAIFGRATAVLQSVTETALPVLKENDTTRMPELAARTTAAVQTVTETSLPYIEQMTPHNMEIVQRITVRTLLPLTETRLPRLNDFDTTITAICRGKATAALQNISETRLPELEE